MDKVLCGLWLGLQPKMTDAQIEQYFNKLRAEIKNRYAQQRIPVF